MPRGDAEHREQAGRGQECECARFRHGRPRDRGNFLVLVGYSHRMALTTGGYNPVLPNTQGDATGAEKVSEPG